jgi:hypothetical protein
LVTSCIGARAVRGSWGWFDLLDRVFCERGRGGIKIIKRLILTSTLMILQLQSLSETSSAPRLAVLPSLHRPGSQPLLNPVSHGQ